MKNIYIIISVLVLCLLPDIIAAQNEFEMHEGETIRFDNKGNIIKTPGYKEITSKNAPDVIETKHVEKNSIYNDDGTLKIPGYTPIGNKIVDEQNYIKAKYLLYQNNPDEYKKIFEKKSSDVQFIVTYEEFKKLPENKQKLILDQPKKYYIDMSTEYKDCE